MKIRDSGMPDEATWETFFDPLAILQALAFTGREREIADFGCGYGTFALAAARRTRGKVHAIDIDPAMLAVVAARAQAAGLDNIRTIERDFVAVGTALPAGSVDYAMLFNILHAENPHELLAEAHRILRIEGRAAVVHWVHDPCTPRGPDLSIRPTPEDCKRWLVAAGFALLVPEISLPPHHFGVVGCKVDPPDSKSPSSGTGKPHRSFPRRGYLLRK